MVELTEIEKEVLNYVLLQTHNRAWDSPFETYNRIPYYLTTQYRMNDLVTINQYKKKIHDFLSLGEYIKEEGLYTYSFIKPNGYDLWKCRTIEAYVKFKGERKALQDAEDNIERELKDITIAKTKQDLLIGKHLLKTKWLPYIVSVATAVWSVFVFIDGNSGESKQQQQIQNLETKLQATKSEIWRVLDSVYQKEHIADTTKKNAPAFP